MTIGIIGLGEMGGGMMKRLLLAGSKPAGYNRTQSKATAVYRRRDDVRRFTARARRDV